FAFVDTIHGNREQLARGGCPLGGLCTELHREGGALAKKSAALFNEPMRWLEEQFRALGHEKDSRELGVHFFSAFQGMAAVALGTMNKLEGKVARYGSVAGNRRGDRRADCGLRRVRTTLHRQSRPGRAVRDRRSACRSRLGNRLQVGTTRLFRLSGYPSGGGR